MWEFMVRSLDASGHPIQGSGHQPHIGQPDQVQKLVVEFLSRLEG